MQELTLSLWFIQSVAGMVDDQLHFEMISDQPHSPLEAQYQAQLAPHIELLNQLIVGLVLRLSLNIQAKPSLHGLEVSVQVIQAIELRFGLNS